jgi:superfamily II DNA/RNA helicase
VCWLIWFTKQLFINAEKAIVFASSDIAPILSEVIKSELAKDEKEFVFVATTKNTVDKRTKILDEFSRSYIGILLTTYKISGVGLNLQTANHIIYLTLPPTSKYFKQCLGRIKRIGQKSKTLQIHKVFSCLEESVIWDFFENRGLKLSIGSW